jgi:RNA polymerase sigma-70 factor (ECF subfamily)
MRSSTAAVLSGARPLTSTPKLRVARQGASVQRGAAAIERGSKPRTAADLKLASDAALVEASQAADHAAFEELVRRYDQAVLRLALHLSGSESEAQDIYQEAFLKAYRSIVNFRFECSFYTWMYRIVTNLCLDHLRNRRIRREDPPVTVGSNGEQIDLLSLFADSRPYSNPERTLLVRELKLRIEHALRKLTPRERMVFELKHYQGLRLRAVGEILNTTEETIKSTLFRATRKLRTILADAY